ncbi:MAG: hydroxyacylglutathione hydrolase [Acetobacteraceae bacterium]|nr:hydroxyacylglutathione hydrolase [Acetobacteraceae bacterium]
MSVIATPLPILSDNYAWLLRDTSSGAVAVVDPADARAVIEAVKREGGRLDLILLTHHHDDHIAGTDEVRARFGCKVVGAAADAYRLPPLDQAVREGDTVALGQAIGRVIDTPGHTRGHISYYFPDGGVLICADTLFSLGCGKLLEGTAEEMFSSLQKFSLLPGETLVCCGHEYTESNARFALSVDPDNAALQARAAEVKRLRAEGKPAVPSTIASELAANPFIRATDAEMLGRLRAKKDVFR